MEGMLTYVEDQLATCQAAAPIAMPTAPTPFDLEKSPTQHCQCNVVKIIKILDPSTFYAEPQKDKILYKDWHLQMLNKMSANKLSMPTETLKLAYVQSFTADNAFAQIKPRLDPNATKPFATANEMFEVLTAAFSNAFRKQEARMEYRSLR